MSWQIFFVSAIVLCKNTVEILETGQLAIGRVHSFLLHWWQYFLILNLALTYFRMTRKMKMLVFMNVLPQTEKYVWILVPQASTASLLRSWCVWGSRLAIGPVCHSFLLLILIFSFFPCLFFYPNCIVILVYWYSVYCCTHSLGHQKHFFCLTITGLLYSMKAEWSRSGSVGDCGVFRQLSEMWLHSSWYINISSVLLLQCSLRAILPSGVQKPIPTLSSQITCFTLIV